jgi:hypothetical protein
MGVRHRRVELRNLKQAMRELARQSGRWHSNNQ